MTRSPEAPDRAPKHDIRKAQAERLRRSAVRALDNPVILERAARICREARKRGMLSDDLTVTVAEGPGT